MRTDERSGQHAHTDTHTCHILALFWLSAVASEVASTLRLDQGMLSARIAPCDAMLCYAMLCYAAPCFCNTPTWPLDVASTAAPLPSAHDTSSPSVCQKGHLSDSGKEAVYDAHLSRCMHMGWYKRDAARRVGAGTPGSWVVSGIEQGCQRVR